MRDYDENIVQLIQLYLTGDLSEEEKVKLEDWILHVNGCLMKFAKRGMLSVILKFTNG